MGGKRGICLRFPARCSRIAPAPRVVITKNHLQARNFNYTHRNTKRLGSIVQMRKPRVTWSKDTEQTIDLAWT